MEGERLDALRAAGQAFLDGLRPADEAALVAFSEEISWLAAATADKASVRAALSRLRADGATSALDALYAAVALSEEAGSALIVLFTDGVGEAENPAEEQLGDERLLACLGNRAGRSAQESADALLEWAASHEVRPVQPRVEGQGEAARIVIDDE